MITGMLSQWQRYASVLPPYLTERLHWASLQDWDSREDGKIVLSERDYVNVEQGTTEPVAQRQWEAHREYLDVHLMLAGSEQIDWAVLAGEAPSESYPERDLYFYPSGIAAQGRIEMRRGMFVVMYPWDLHRPLVALHEPMRVRKAIMKLAVPND